MTQAEKKKKARVRATIGSLLSQIGDIVRRLDHIEGSFNARILAVETRMDKAWAEARACEAKSAEPSSHESVLRQMVGAGRGATAEGTMQLAVSLIRRMQAQIEELMAARSEGEEE